MPVTVSRVILSGGEPTIYPHLQQILRELERRGHPIGFITNGRRFVYPKFCKYVLSKGANYFYVSLHSHNAQIHDTITGCENSWQETWDGINNLIRFEDSAEIIINCVVNRSNCHTLLELVALLAQTKISRVKFSVPEIKGLAAVDKSSKLLPLDEAAAHIVAALEHGDRLGMDCAWDGLPYCYLPRRLRQRQDTLESQGIYYMAELTDEAFYFTDESSRSQVEACRICSFHAVCAGYYNGYEKLGSITVKPINRTVPNHFFLSRVGRLTGRASSCFAEKTQHSQVSPLSLVFFEEDQASVYQAEVSFFKRENIFRSKQQGQLYLDRNIHGETGRIDNLHQLSLLPVCRNCPNGCLGMYQSEPAKPFFFLSSRMKEVLLNLRGDVLDVGFGELYLEDILFTGLAGQINYTGVDPNWSDCKSAAMRHPQGNFSCSTLEKADFADNSFDYILFLGSYSHIEDIQAGLQNAHRMLRPNGKILIIENSVFGLLRRLDEKEIGARENFGSYEHFRNDSLADATHVLKAHGFSMLEAEEVSSACNLWMLLGTLTATSEGVCQNALSSESP